MTRYFNDIDKFAIIGDIHVGKSKDSVVKQNAIMNAIDWTISTLSSENIKTVVIAGDIHDNRNAVSLTTMGVSDKIISKLSKLFNVVILAGNHDTAMREGNSDSLHSLHMFKHMPNVLTVVSEPYYETVNNKTIAIVPWGCDINEIQKNSPDIAIGHFEYSGARIAGGVSKSGVSMKDLSKIAKVVLSGHYHIREERVIDGNSFLSVGSLIELDWGDAATQKGIHIVDLQSLNVKFIECHLRPKHVYLTLSKLLTKQETISEDIIKDNFIKLVIDRKIKYDAVRKLIVAINKCNPIVPCIPEFQQTMTIERPKENMERISQRISDKRQYLMTYVDKLKDLNLSHCTIDDIKKSISEYYDKAMLKIGA